MCYLFNVSSKFLPLLFDFFHLKGTIEGIKNTLIFVTCDWPGRNTHQNDLWGFTYVKNHQFVYAGGLVNIMSLYKL